MPPPTYFKQVALYPASPSAERGSYTKLSINNKDQLVYANGKTVIIRDLKNPALTSIYSGHTRNVSVARFSPSGYYCASADVQGSVRVWDTVGEDRTLKGEWRAISGRINDLAWDGESKRIVAVGDAKEKMAHAFMFDSGTSTGDISGHTKAINAVSIRHLRPFRAATASDDGAVVFHAGVPWKFEKTIRNHTKFVQDVKYSPSGDHFASVGSDAKIFLYDGKTGDTVGEIVDSAHTGTIMACSWAQDNKTLVTSSADRTVKLWDVETRKAIQFWTVGPSVSDQQVGNAYSASGDIVSLSISGELNVFNAGVKDKPTRILKGAQKSITAGSITSSGIFLAGAADGRIVQFSSAGEADDLSGENHTNYVSSITVQGDKVYSVGFDDKLREFELQAKQSTTNVSALSTQPKATAVAADGTVFIVESEKLEVFRSNQKLTEIVVKYGPMAVAASGETIAVGGNDNIVHLYSWDGIELKEKGTLEGNRGAITQLAFSPDGALLASGETTGKIVLFGLKEGKAIESRWTSHTARIHSLSWTEDGVHLASGSLDTNVFVWSVKKPVSNIAIRNAGPGGVSAVAWLESGGKMGKLVSAGADSCVRVWEVTFRV